MEVLIEVLIELFGQLFGELILTAIAKLIGLFFRKVNTDHLLRSRIKFILTYLFLGLVIALIISSMLNRTGFLVIISLSYMLFQLFITLLLVLNKDREKHFFMKIVRILRSISHYVYPILLIIFSSLYLENQNLLISINILSTLTIFVWILMDSYKIWKYFKKNR
ncbi:Uncharacterised protein [Acholeplasma oculi]|uniref:Uncharacterized protein n=1 Tax=Acholeplasma oculi TaxID=35623 RepID=A0A061AIT0_9MOLU|nr:hypothetical protein [Acholeplasma oculi]CDR30902.1 hypothetical protein Aocu_08290 [Acholeplasma oculi]SKC35491.1 hypothetical protein SAMN02745122_0254 [Acholeplasma oculi]SUT90097.1 Uncharacterised protein [Acholeplasma oculi]